MDENPLNALFGNGEATPPPAVETPQDAPPAAPQPSDGPARDEQGRFAPKPAEAAPAAPEGEGETPVSEAGEVEKPLTKRELDGMLKATMAERDRRQEAQRKAEAAEKEVAALKARLAEIEAKANPTPAEETAEQRLHAKVVRLEAEVRHGADAVKGAYAWAVAKCDADPLFNAKAAALIAHLGNPFEAAVALKKEHDDLDALRASAAAPASPTPPAAPAASPAPPPRSLATATNAGGPGASTDVPIGPGEAYRAVIR